MISIQHSLSVTYKISHLIRADKRRNTRYTQAQRGWRCTLEFRMIRMVGWSEIEFHCRLAQCVISEKLDFRDWLAVNQNGVWNAIWWIGGEKRCATRKGWVPDMKCRVGKGSDDCDGGVRNEIEGHISRPRSTYPAEEPFHAERHQQGREVNSLEWNRGTPNRGRGGDGGVPIAEEERQQK
jgi:hypothetical protein